MEYAIAPLAARSAESIRISEEEYLAIAEAKDGLIAIIGIEQKFGLVLENYLEYERELLDLALHQVVFHDFRYEVSQREGLGVTRRLANLLSAGRLYLDQIKHDLSTAFGKRHEIIAAVQHKCREEYDARLGFRLMETLRNTMQHRSISAVLLKYETRADDAPVGDGVRTRVIPLLSTADLRDAGIKASVYQEIAGAGDFVALAGHVRDYLDGLAAVHYELRGQTKSDRQSWESSIRQVYRRGADRWSPGPLRASQLVAMEDSGKVKDSRHIFLEPLEYLVGLEKKNAGPLRLRRLYVSNAAEANDA